MTKQLESVSAGRKLGRAVGIGAILSIALFFVWLLVYDRQSQSAKAQKTVAAGWGDAQTMSGPVLVIPYRPRALPVVTPVGGAAAAASPAPSVSLPLRELILEPEQAAIRTEIAPEIRSRSIYEAVVYSAANRGTARFALPADFDRFGVALDQLALANAELRFGLSDPRGLGANPRVTVNGRAVRLQPSGGSGKGNGFLAFVDAAALVSGSIQVRFDYEFRGNGSIGLAPHAADTDWTVRSSWPSPSFTGSFLPGTRRVEAKGFNAKYRIGNLGLGRSIVRTADRGASDATSPSNPSPDRRVAGIDAARPVATIGLVRPVDLYSRIDRSVKYGFLFIGFTFLALFMFDVVAGVRVSPIEYLLMGAALVLFFVLLLAFAEVIGFSGAYVLAAIAIAGLNTAYSAAVLGSWRRGFVIGGMLAGLYAVLYVLLGLEAFSMVIGSVLLFLALAGVMYATRRLDWGAASERA